MGDELTDFCLLITRAHHGTRGIPASFAFAHRRPEIPLPALDIYQRPRILEGFDLKMIFLIDLELTRWQECP
jgi:hypothetical protein